MDTITIPIVDILSKQNFEKYLDITQIVREPALSLKSSNKVFIAGGFPLRLYTNTTLEGCDLDLFFNCSSALEKWYGVSSCRTISHEPTVWAYTFAKKPHNIQLIRKYYDNSEKLFQSFDFTICQIAIDVITNCFILTEQTRDDIHNKLLRVSKDHNKPLNASRIDKYTGMGFIPTDKNIISELLLYYMNNKKQKTKDYY